MKKLLISIILLLSINESFCVQNDTWLKKIETYFKENDNCESDFEQMDSQGTISEGHFYLKRNKQLMKLVYKSPNPHVIIVSGNKLVHYDKELKEKTETSIYSSPLSFFLEKSLDLQSNVRILQVINRDGIVAIKLCKKDDDESSIMLVFSKKTFKLQSWIIFYNEKDEYSRFTKIRLKNPKYHVNFSDRIFKNFS